MKTLALFLVLLTTLFGGYFIGYTAHERERQHQIYINPDFENPVFIWNDDLEALPTEGSDIKIDLIQSDTIYLGSKD
jgi:hypothetical protein